MKEILKATFYAIAARLDNNSYCFAKLREETILINLGIP